MAKTKALSLLQDADDAAAQTAHAVAGAAGLEATDDGKSTALLCSAVEPNAVLFGADDVVEVVHQLDAAPVLAGEGAVQNAAGEPAQATMYAGISNKFRSGSRRYTR